MTKIAEKQKMTSKQIADMNKEYTFYSWSVQGQVDPIPVVKAEGVYFWDADGKRYLDFASQLVNTNVGHQHPKVVKAIQDQAARLTFVAPGMASEPRGLLGKKLAEITPGDLNKTFFTLGGAEANENAIKIARFYHRAEQNTGTVSFLSRRNPWGDCFDRRLPASCLLSQRCPEWCISSTRTATAAHSVGHGRPAIGNASATLKKSYSTKGRTRSRQSSWKG